MASNQKKKQRKPLSAKAKKAISIILAVVIVIGAASAYVATGAMKKGFLSYLQIPQKTLTAITVSNGEDEFKITPAQYNYYFASAYNNLYSQVNMYTQYGLDLKESGFNVDFEKSFDKQIKDEKKGTTWADYMEQQTKDQILDIVTYYNEALKANDGKAPKLSKENQKTIDDAIKSYKESADKYGYTLDAFLKKSMGRGVSEKLIREEMKKSLIATDYKSSIKNKHDSTEYTAEQLQKYYSDNIADLSYVDFKGFVAKDEKTAAKIVKEINADGSNFAEIISKYAESDYEKEAYKNESKSYERYITKETAKGKYGLDADGLNWLYSTDRNTNDIKAFGSSVIFVLKPYYQSDVATADVRHILIAPKTDKEGAEATTATTAQWNEAKAKADEIYNKWVSDGKTEDTFGALAKENTADTGSKDNGGLITGAYPGQMVNEFGNWCFTDGRKTGDCEIVKSDYGYHIIYFVKTNAPYWQVTAQTKLSSGDSDTTFKGIADKYKLEVNWFGAKFFSTDKNFG